MSALYCAGVKTIHLLLVFAVAGCAARNPAPQHGTISNLSRAPASEKMCEHQVPSRACVRCHPELAERFKTVGDWCGEHGIPESQCLQCHPDLTFAVIEPPDGTDLGWISERGEDAELTPVDDKVTVFDFYADWCAPCRKVDQHVYKMLAGRNDVAVRKVNIVSWDSPVAKRHLAAVSRLPYLIVHARDGRRVGAVTGLDLPALDGLIDEGAKQ